MDLELLVPEHKPLNKYNTSTFNELVPCSFKRIEWIKKLDKSNIPFSPLSSFY